MSTLDGPIWSRCSIALTCPAMSHFQRTLIKERWGRGWDERYRSSRKADEEGQEKRKQATNFKKAVCCPTEIVQGQHSEKMKGSA